MNRVLVLVVLTSACGVAPTANVYCDGTTNWPCNDPAYPVCDVAGQMCIAALNGDMSVPHEADADYGVGCSSSAECPDSTPICESQQCRACAGTADDAQCAVHAAATPVCDSSTGHCVACLPASGSQSTNCQAATPICGTDGHCRACALQSECTSQVCNLDGTCADSSTVLYVNNANGTCTGTTHTGAIGDPYCQIQDAVMNLGTKTVIRVFGSSTAYGAVTITSGTVSIVGPTTGTTAKLSGDASNPALSVSGGSTVVGVDAMEVTGIFAAQTGIYCSNGTIGPKLSILRSSIHGLAGLGISATDCKVTLDRDAIYANTNGGIALNASQYSIQNCMIYGNTSTGSAPGVLLSGSSELPGGFGFQHNTVAKNTTLTGVAGIACNSGITTIRNSIIWQNGTMDTGGSGTCSLVGSSVNPTPAPDFVNATGPAFDFHLAGRTTANNMCCVDKIATSTDDHDFDGRARPQPPGGLFDVGAHEVP